MAREYVKVIGLEHLEAVLKEKAEEVRAAGIETVAKGVLEGQQIARQIAPVRTGELREGIRTESMGESGTIKSTSDHAGFVEFGTTKMSAEPYMAPMAQRMKTSLPKTAMSIFRKLLGA